MVPETSRLIFRQFTIADAPLVLALNSEPEVLRYLHEPMLPDEEAAGDIITNNIIPQYQHHLGRWALFLKSNLDFLGWCGLKFRPELNEVDLGYRFHKAFWGQGFATEAATATLSYGFDTLALQDIMGRAHVHNAASQKVLMNCGFRYVKDEIVDDSPVKTYCITQPRWKEHNELLKR